MYGEQLRRRWPRGPRHCHLFVDAGVDAVITNVAQPLAALETEHAPPAVLVSDARIEGFAASVHINVFEGTYQAVSHLIEMGHRRIAHLGAGAHGERYRAYAQAMRDAGLQEELWAYGDRAWRREELQERVEAIVREQLQDRRSLPTAVVAHDDFMALIGVADRPRSSAFRCPKTFRSWGTTTPS